MCTRSARTEKWARRPISMARSSSWLRAHVETVPVVGLDEHDQGSAARLDGALEDVVLPMKPADEAGARGFVDLPEVPVCWMIASLITITLSAIDIASAANA